MSPSSYIDRNSVERSLLHDMLANGSDELGSNSTNNASPVEAVMFVVTRVYIGFVLCIGFVGNVLSVAMLLTSPLRRRSPTQYLLALAVVDIGVLLTFGITWLKGFGVRIYQLPIICQLTTYLNYLCSSLSGWFVTIFTVERFIIVFYPFYRPRAFNVRRARTTVIIVVVIGAVMNAWVLVFATSSDGHCGVPSEPMETFLILTCIDMLITFGIPCIIIASLNCAIAWQISKSIRIREQLTVDLYSTGVEQAIIIRKSIDDHPEIVFEKSWLERLSKDPMMRTRVLKKMSRCGTIKRSRSIKRYNERRITVLLLTVSLVYLLLNIPKYSFMLHQIIYLWLNISHGISEVSIVGENRDLNEVIDKLFLMLFYTQYSINFFLYTCQGRLYKSLACILRMLKCNGCQSRNNGGFHTPLLGRSMSPNRNKTNGSVTPGKLKTDASYPTTPTARRFTSKYNLPLPFNFS